MNKDTMNSHLFRSFMISSLVGTLEMMMTRVSLNVLLVSLVKVSRRLSVPCDFPYSHCQLFSLVASNCVPVGNEFVINLPLKWAKLSLVALLIFMLSSSCQDNCFLCSQDLSAKIQLTL